MDVRAKSWTCPFCLTRNPLPQNYGDISEVNLPAELIPQHTTIDYCLPRGQPLSPAYIFVVDTCLIPEELEAMKNSIIMALTLMPPTSLVGLITFGKTVKKKQHYFFFFFFG